MEPHTDNVSIHESAFYCRAVMFAVSILQLLALAYSIQNICKMPMIASTNLIRRQTKPHKRQTAQGDKSQKDTNPIFPVTLSL